MMEGPQPNSAEWIVLAMFLEVAQDTPLYNENFVENFIHLKYDDDWKWDQGTVQLAVANLEEWGLVQTERVTSEGQGSAVQSDYGAIKPSGVAFALRHANDITRAALELGGQKLQRRVSEMLEGCRSEYNSASSSATSRAEFSLSQQHWAVLGALIAIANQEPNTKATLSRLNMLFKGAYWAEDIERVLDDLLDWELLVDGASYVEELSRIAGWHTVTVRGVLYFFENIGEFFEHSHLPLYDMPDEIIDPISGIYSAITGESESSSSGNSASPKHVIPASDRVVPLNHNAPEYVEAVKTLDDVIKEFREDHSFGNSRPQDKERVLRELEAGKDLMKEETARPRAIGELVLPALKWILDAFGKGVVFVAATEAYAAIKIWLVGLL